MKKIINIIIFVILLIVLLLNIFSLYGFSFFGFRVYKVGSGSMEPYLKINDVVIIKKSNDYKVNDIITYKNDNDYITHRIISINNSEIITKGDANNIEDKPITKNQIVGKLVYKFHVFGFIGYLLSKPFTWILLFIIGLVITYYIPEKLKQKEIIFIDDDAE